MMIALISYRGEKVTDVLLPKWSSDDKSPEFDKRIDENIEQQSLDGFTIDDNED